MTLHPIPLNFLIYEENFIYFFISVQKICPNQQKHRKLWIYVRRIILPELNYSSRDTIPLRTLEMCWVVGKKERGVGV
jgi:hypothetical protein